MATAPEPQVGATVAIVVGVPASEVASNYAALSWIEIGNVTSVPEVGDDSETGTVTLLKEGRTQHFNGAKVVPPFDLPYVYNGSDAGQVIIRANINGSTEVSMRITDNDGEVHYIQGVLGNLRGTERSASSYKGEIVSFRSITGWTRA